LLTEDSAERPLCATDVLAKAGYVDARSPSGWRTRAQLALRQPSPRGPKVLNWGHGSIVGRERRDSRDRHRSCPARASGWLECRIRRHGASQPPREPGCKEKEIPGKHPSLCALLSCKTDLVGPERNGASYLLCRGSPWTPDGWHWLALLWLKPARPASTADDAA